MEKSLDQWIGREQLVEDCLHDTPLAAMQATLEGIQANFPDDATVPCLWHWLYFLDKPPQTRLADDGHESRGHFLPPVSLPGRMWAAGNLNFHAPLVIGKSARRESRIKSIESRQGRSGALVFVRVQHSIYCETTLAVSEEQTIVYRERATNPVTPAGLPVTEATDFEKKISPDILLLFRYSALTFNAHRIHYDRDYACGKEGYPGLIVHGPLLATLLAGSLQERYPDQQLQSFEFRALKPVFDLNPFSVCGQHPDENGLAKLWIADSDNELCMTATAMLQS